MTNQQDGGGEGAPQKSVSPLTEGEDGQVHLVRHLLRQAQSVQAESPEAALMLMSAAQFNVEQRDRLIDMQSSATERRDSLQRYHVEQNFRQEELEREAKSLEQKRQFLVTVLALGSVVALVALMLIIDKTEHMGTLLGALVGFLGGGGAGYAAAMKSSKEKGSKAK